MFDADRRRVPLEHRLKTASKRILRTVFELGQRIGVDILPRHFYSAIPDIAAMRSEVGWRRPYSLIGVRGVDVADQVEVLARWCPPSTVAGGDVYKTACSMNGEIGYGPIEAEVLYCFIHTMRPRRVIQIGCGVATAVVLLAARDAGLDLQITCVEPFPSRFLRAEAAAGTLELIEQPAEAVDFDCFEALGAGDLLFVDSTHTVRPGNEVSRLVLEILPRLATGCFVHFHDIHWPHDYTPGVLTDDLFFWTEASLLHAFLIDNRRFTIRASLSLVHHHDPAALKRILPRYRPAHDVDGLLSGHAARSDSEHFPSSTYLQVVGDANR